VDEPPEDIIEEDELPEEAIEPTEEEIEAVEVEAADTSEEADQVDIEFIAEEPPVHEAATIVDNGRQMAIDLIHEALEADEIISAEIEKVSKEELDTALEAFSHDEVLPANGEEEEVDKDLDEDSKRELAMLLGVSEPLKRDEEESESEEMRSVDMEAIFEIDAILGIEPEEESKDKSDQ
jgi:hypothetical protein